MKNGILQKVFNEILRESQASIPELETGTASVEGAEFVVRAILSEHGLRRIFSLIIAPTSPEPDAASAKAADASEATKASQRYFSRVVDLLKDHEREPQCQRLRPHGPLARELRRED